MRVRGIGSVPAIDKEFPEVGMRGQERIPRDEAARNDKPQFPESFFRPFGACWPPLGADPRLAPWAAFFRRSAAGLGSSCARMDGRGRLSLHKPSVPAAELYGNSRVTNFASLGPGLATVWELLAGYHLLSPGFRATRELRAVEAEPWRMRLRTSMSLAATRSSGPWGWVTLAAAPGWSSNSETRMASLTKRICWVPPGKSTRARSSFLLEP